MHIDMKKQNEKIDVKINSPKGQDIFVKQPFYSPGNQLWLAERGYINADYKFTPEAEKDGIVEAVVIQNTAEFGRGVRGQTMFIPKVHAMKSHKGYFGIKEEAKK